MTIPPPLVRLRVAMAQINATVGDLDGNADLIVAAAADAAGSGADVVVLPEMALTGYPVEDLALRPAFRVASEAALAALPQRLAEAGAGELLVVVGFLGEDTGGIRDACAAIHAGAVVARVNKHHLPNYGVFDEVRWFVPATASTIVRFRGVDIGMVVCEDLWQRGGSVAALGNVGIDLLVAPNASPFEQEKAELRAGVLTNTVGTVRAPVVYCNLVGGQDDLVFDGGSVIMDADGRIVSAAPRFRPALTLHDLELPVSSRPTDAVSSLGMAIDVVVVDGPQPAVSPGLRDPLAATITPDLADEDELWQALVLGLGDYVRKIGFRSVVLGLSGGIDSAVVAALAVDAIGADNVHAVSMPSVYSSDHSKDDAAEMGRRTGLHYRVEPIAGMVGVFKDQLELSGLAEENLQARCRGVTLMALSNAEGHLVLATGNKSELACGYSTIYGDAVGGFAPLKDVFKTWVWRIARWRNAVAAQRGEIPPIPENSITKPPSAELRPGQLDSDSLPEYDVLDRLLDAYVEGDLWAPDLVAQGFDAEMVSRVITMVDRAEWKRRQYPLGPKVTERAFGRDRRLPVTSRWDGN